MKPKFTRWSKAFVAIAGIGLSLPAFAANWTREEVAAARTGSKARVQLMQRQAAVARCSCPAACAHAAHP